MAVRRPTQVCHWLTLIRRGERANLPVFARIQGEREFAGYSLSYDAVIRTKDVQATRFNQASRRYLKI